MISMLLFYLPNLTPPYPLPLPFYLHSRGSSVPVDMGVTSLWSWLKEEGMLQHLEGAELIENVDGKILAGTTSSSYSNNNNSSSSTGSSK